MLLSLPSLPYNRPHLIEIHDQPWCPPIILRYTQSFLTYLWTHRIPPFQARAPYEIAAEVLEAVVDDVDKGDTSVFEKDGCKGTRIVDCCSGGGGPMPLIERRLNQRRRAEGRRPIPVLLSDLHPHLSAWTVHAKNPQSTALAFLPYPVDATHAPSEVRRGCHIRTFCLSFHHFNEESARKILEDAMRSSEAICIFEMQAPDIGSIITILCLFPLSYLVTPFLQPSFTILLLVYVIPVLPIILVLDGLVSAWRTRPLPHIKHLSRLASLTLALEGTVDPEGREWTWHQGSATHTRPFGRITWVVGRRVTVEESQSDGASSSDDQDP